MKKQKKNPSAVSIADDPSHVRSEISVSFRRIFPPIYRPVRSLFDGFERGAMSFLAASVSKLIDEFEFHQISHSKWRNKRVVTGLNSALFRKSEKAVMLEPSFAAIENRPEWRQFWKKERYSSMEKAFSEIEFNVSKGNIEDSRIILSDLKGKGEKDDDVL